MVKKYFILGFLCLAIAHVEGVTPKEVLAQLMEGNRRFLEEKSVHMYSEEAHQELVTGQSPIAVIIGCSDSRVPPEILFDQGLGALFVVRDAGNVVGPIELDSAEFAVIRLSVPLIMVLGHQNCGAVQAVLSGPKKPNEFSTIYPLIASGLAKCPSSTKLIDAIYCNVRNTMDALKTSPQLKVYVQQKKLMIVGGYFDIGSGKVVLIQ